MMNKDLHIVHAFDRILFHKIQICPGFQFFQRESSKLVMNDDDDDGDDDCNEL